MAIKTNEENGVTEWHLKPIDTKKLISAVQNRTKKLNKSCVVMNYNQEDIVSRVFVTSYVKDNELYTIYEETVVTARDKDMRPLAKNKVLQVKKVCVDTNALEHLKELIKYNNFGVDYILRSENKLEEFTNECV